MPITKNGQNELVETPILDDDQFKRTGVVRQDEFAICDSHDRLKQIQFDASAEQTNTKTTLKMGAITSDTVITFPSITSTLATTAGATDSFSIIQPDTGTAPTADSPTDTLTVTSSDGSVLVDGNSTTDTITLTTPANKTNQKVIVSKAGSTVGTRKQINIIDGSNITTTVADDVGNDRVNITIAATDTGITQLTSDVTAGPGSGSQAATITSHAVSNAKFRQSAALSVVGNSTNATADVADIAAASDNQVLRRSGTAVGFGAVNLASSNAVTGVLPNANTTGTAANTASTLVARDSSKTFQVTRITGDDGNSYIDFNTEVISLNFEGDPTAAISWGARTLSEEGSTSVDWGLKKLFHGDVTRLDWQANKLYDDTGSTTVDWQSKILNDGSEVGRVQWESGLLASQNGEVRLTWDDTGISVDHLMATPFQGGVPNITAGTGAGVSGTASIASGVDGAMELQIDTGSVPSTGATICTLTFANPYPFAPYVCITPSNANAALLAGVTGVYVNSTTSTFLLKSGTTGLTASTEYKWHVHVIGRTATP